MAKRRTNSNRRDLAAWLMMVLPGFMFLGMLAPAAVTVKPKAEDEIGPISFRNFRPRRPIQFSLPIGAASDATLQPMFAGARYIFDQARQVFDVDLVADDRARQEIVLAQDDVEDYVAETLFEGSEEDLGVLVVDLDPLWDPSVFDVIPELIDRRGFSQWDDFHGTSVPFVSGPPANVIPEPAPSGLVAIGLAALAMRRKRA
jgi:hypothetical protein